MHVLITGGAGYVGHALVPALLADGHHVTVYDTLWFGNHLRWLPGLHVIQGDIRNTPKLSLMMRGHDAVIHLACVSNDASFELDEKLSTSINFDCFEPMVIAAKQAGVKRFIYCSSSSVYGVSDAPDVTEDHPLVPLTLYNKYKGLCEPLLFKHGNADFTTVVLRPATLCGYSPRQRLDLSVNILTNHAINKGVITVYGGEQMRPNLHIDDMVDAYRLLLTAPHEKVHREIFNVGGENHSINDLAAIVQNIIGGVDIVHVPSNDQRSYHVNSDKIARVLGFKPKRSVVAAVVDLMEAFGAGLLPDSFDDDRYYNIRIMKRLP